MEFVHWNICQVVLFSRGINSVGSQLDSRLLGLWQTHSHNRYEKCPEGHNDGHAEVDPSDTGAFLAGLYFDAGSNFPSSLSGVVVLPKR